jgi:hypothetical protein
MCGPAPYFSVEQVLKCSDLAANLHSMTELFYVTARMVEESSRGKSGYPRNLYICKRGLL